MKEHVHRRSLINSQQTRTICHQSTILDRYISAIHGLLYLVTNVKTSCITWGQKNIGFVPCPDLPHPKQWSWCSCTPQSPHWSLLLTHTMLKIGFQKSTHLTHKSTFTSTENLNLKAAKPKTTLHHAQSQDSRINHETKLPSPAHWCHSQRRSTGQTNLCHNFPPEKLIPKNQNDVCMMSPRQERSKGTLLLQTRDLVKLTKIS